MMPPHIYPGDRVRSTFVPDDIVRTVRAVFVEPSCEGSEPAWYAVSTEDGNWSDPFFVDPCSDLVLVERAPIPPD